MRCVVYDPQDLEALTVIDIPQGFIRELENGRMGPILRFPIYEELDWRAFDAPPNLPELKIATVMMERFHYRNATTWVAIAMNPEICLLMRSDLLPGQRRDDIKRQKNAFVKGLLAAIGS